MARGALNLHHLATYCAVVEQRSFSAAARELMLTQSAISQHVRALEDYFGTVLLRRSGRRIIPTEAGEALYRYGAEILSKVDIVDHVMDDLRGEQGSRILMGAGTVPGNYVLPPLLVKFQRDNPSIRLMLRVDRAEQIFQEVLHGQLDFAVTHGARIPGGLISQPIYQEEVCVVVGAQSWQKAGSRTLSAEEAAQMKLVAQPGRRSVLRRYWDDYLRQRGLEPNIGLALQGPESIKLAVASGYGVALMYRSSVARELTSGVLKELSVEGLAMSRPYVLIHRAGKFMSPATQELMAFLRSELPKHQMLQHSTKTELSMHANSSRG